MTKAEEQRAKALQMRLWKARFMIGPTCPACRTEMLPVRYHATNPDGSLKLDPFWVCPACNFHL